MEIFPLFEKDFSGPSDAELDDYRKELHAALVERRRKLSLALKAAEEKPKPAPRVSLAPTEAPLAPSEPKCSHHNRKTVATLTRAYEKQIIVNKDRKDGGGFSRTKIKDDRCNYYPLDEDKRGLVLYFYWTKDRQGNAEDLKAVKATFQGRLDCELRPFKDHTSWQLRRTFKQLEEEFSGQNFRCDYNYLIVIFAAHGDNDAKVGNFIRVADDSRISCSEVEDFLTCGYRLKAFMGRPKVIVWNSCRGRRAPIVMQTDNVKARPLYSDYLILWSAEKDMVSVRDVQGGSCLIQHLCKAINEEPECELECLIKGINRKLSRSENALEINEDFSIVMQYPYMANLNLHFSLSKSKLWC